MSDSRVLRAALAYARLGWATFPVYGCREPAACELAQPADSLIPAVKRLVCACKKGPHCLNPGKHPRTPRGYKDASTVESVIRTAFSAGSTPQKQADLNVGLATGEPSGIWALDIDPRHNGNESLAQLVEQHGPLPNTVEAITGAGGRHFLFQLPNGASPKIKCAAGVLPGVDIRGQGGYIVVAPSLHVSGRCYEWEISSRPGDVPVAPAPDWLLQFLRGTLPAGPDGDETTQASAPPLPETLTEGRRHEWLVSFAGTMRRRGAEPPEIEAALAAMNANRCVPPLPDAEVAAIARSMAHYEANISVGPILREPVSKSTGDGATGTAPTDALPTVTPIPTAEPSTQAGTGPRPRVVINGRSLAAVVKDAWRAVVTHEAKSGDPSVFVRDRDIVRVVIPAGERPRRIEAFGPEAWSHALSVVASFCRTKLKESTGETSFVECFPPLDATRAMLASPTRHLPPLESIISTPRFAADGTLLGAKGEGYYRAHAVYFVGSWPVSALPPTVPTLQEVVAARALILDDLLVDFPFDGPAERANAVAALLLPFVRPMISGPTPLHFFEAPVPSTGKGLLAATIGIVATGMPVTATPLPETNDEIRKAITSALLGGAEFIFFDNITEWRDLNSAALACALTATLWSDRQLQVNRTLVLRNTATWLASGNNVTASGEIGRRCVRIRMDPHVEKPGARSGFRHPLPEWATANRHALARACLTLVAAWLAEGRPAPASRPFASFEAWSTVLGGILMVAGIPGFLTNRDATVTAMDADTEDWGILIDAWRTRYGSAEIHADDIARLVLEAQIMRRIARITSDHGRATAIGQAIRTVRGRVIAGYTIQWRRDATEGRVFRLERAAVPLLPSADLPADLPVTGI